jgi:hypothetical protein
MGQPRVPLNTQFYFRLSVYFEISVFCLWTVLLVVPEGSHKVDDVLCNVILAELHAYLAEL